MSGYRIVVGFDGSDGSRKALEWAANEARARGGELEVVRAFTPSEFGLDKEQEQITLDSLKIDTEKVIGDTPPFAIKTTVRIGRAAKVLLQISEDADMLVVGSRGHGGFAGLLLGSVSQQVSTHAGAPVVVVVRPEE